MADFDPFANQGGPVAWDPEHAADPKKQAAELSRRIAADDDEGDDASTYPGDGESTNRDELIDPDAEVDDDSYEHSAIDDSGASDDSRASDDTSASNDDADN